MGRNTLASLWVHGVLLGAVLYFADDSPERAAQELVSVDIIDAQAPVASEPEPEPEPEPEAEAGEAGRPAKRGAPPKAATLEEVEPAPTPAASEISDDSPLKASVTGRLNIEVGGEGLGGLSEDGLGLGGFGGGPGRGDGGGDGTGRGRGDSEAGSTGAERATKSKARPARLIYPKRFRQEREGEVFVVTLTVAKNGSVDGVRLRQGVTPHKDEKALKAVWRFRYDPARDKDGRKIESHVVQRFMIY